MLTGGDRHVVTVQNYRKTISDTGKPTYTTPNGPRVDVPCTVHPLSAEEVVTYGLSESETRKAIIRNQPWPANARSRITHDGGVWEQVGPATKAGLGYLTQHTSVVLRRIGDDDG